MIKKICVICMRGNSTGIKNKNLIKINNKYLMQYTINQAIDSNFFDKIVVTSDSEKILKITKNIK